MAGHVTLPRTPIAYPGETTLSAVFDSGECKAVVEQYLGAKLDPDGRFYATGVMPSVESYADGDRDIWCGLARRPDEEQPDQTDPYYLYTGRLRAADQHRVFAIGSCLGGDGDHLSFGTVPCDGPHTVEIAGHVDLGARTGPAPTEDDYQALVGTRCRQLAKTYAGPNLRLPVQSGWLWINEASWDSGMRTVMCTVAEYSGQRPLVITRHLAA